MKKLLLLTAFAAFELWGTGASVVQAASSTNGVPSTFAIVGLFSPANSPVISTNSKGSSTLITSTYISKPVKIVTKDMLNLLATEFNVAFPAGAQLAYDFSGSPQGFVVLDKAGNVFLNVSTNSADSSYRFSLTNSTSIESIRGKTVETDAPSATNTVETLSLVATGYEIIYEDNRGNNFQFSGLATLSANVLATSTATVYKTLSLLVSGSGGGTFFNTADSVYDKGVFTKAAWRASGKNVVLQ